MLVPSSEQFEKKKEELIAWFNDLGDSEKKKNLPPEKKKR